jgi:hypothetical protein
LGRPRGEAARVEPEARGEESETQMTTKEHLTKHDREIAAIRVLIKAGMQMVVKVQEAQKRTAEAQERTEKSLKALIDQMRRSGGNGHAKGKVDVQ